MLPAPLLERARRARRGLEIGAGARFDTALELAQAAPDAEWWVSDLHEDALRAPLPLHGAILDVHAPSGDWSGTDLVFAVRLPEELQGLAARFARKLGADLAIRPLKDEWADVSEWYKRHVVWPDGWRYFPID